ncbi:4Fe-4S dicluster domain-containing protein [Xylophilus sp.]|uniref:4Fe-4S dicluster domain-containing protein n=1 Tax=Xylophilus sp. TaxID=2653893 RepID=UPI0013BA8291|nr:ferredoxin family protein [Xylophilus sp.]KAF1049175.1 MAG: Photosystem I iron-sulfur center [Xylophilus sp.]
MIEFISKERCTGCDLCVQVCPTFVFDKVPGGIPVIARQEDCQTCFMCEAYCPVDALYVSPFADAAQPVDAQALEQSDLLGSYRRSIGWAPGTRGTVPDATFQLLRGL